MLSNEFQQSVGKAQSTLQISNPGLGIYPGLPRWLSSKESACSAGDAGDLSSIPWSGRSPGGGNGNPLQYSCLKKSHVQRSPAGSSPKGHKQSDITEHA